MKVPKDSLLFEDPLAASQRYRRSSVSFEAIPSKRAISVATTTTNSILGSHDSL